MWPCDTCHRRFRYESDCVEHMDHYDHWGERFPCETCSKEFLSEEAADFHMLQLRHFKDYCYDCDRVFANENALRMHLHSSIHQRDNILCPFCHGGFVTPSGVCHHLESGSCFKASHLNREEIHRLIRRADPDRAITSGETEIHNQVQESSQTTQETQSRNKHNPECQLCQREFSNADALSQHLKSDVHKPQIYHCPNKGRCEKQFTSLAAMCAHLESEACGFMPFRKARRMQKQFNRALKGEGIIRF